jgi:S-adenosylmethionine hydrolase
MQSNLITLLTDFGLRDVYVGVIKGVIATINPEVKVIDLSHQIPPQNILAARFALMNAIPYFPDSTIHVGVVDPGVGSKRRGVAIAIDKGYLIGPDNGIFSGILEQNRPKKAVELNNAQYWRTLDISSTFHARDIFAPVAAHLAKGVRWEDLGSEIELDSLTRVDLPTYQHTKFEIIGLIQYIDIFGNLITNIPATAIKHKSWSIKINDIVIPRGETYSSVSPGELVSLVGSHGWVEIAVNGGSAKMKLNQNYSEQVQLLENYPANSQQ